jgi:hypothetical protein
MEVKEEEERPVAAMSLGEEEGPASTSSAIVFGGGGVRTWQTLWQRRPPKPTSTMLSPSWPASAIRERHW